MTLKYKVRWRKIHPITSPISITLKLKSLKKVLIDLHLQQLLWVLAAFIKLGITRPWRVQPLNSLLLQFPYIMHFNVMSCVLTLSTQRVAGPFVFIIQPCMRRSDRYCRTRSSKSGFFKDYWHFCKGEKKTWNSPTRKAFQIFSVNFVFPTSNTENESRATAVTTPHWPARGLVICVLSRRELGSQPNVLFHNDQLGALCQWQGSQFSRYKSINHGAVIKKNKKIKQKCCYTTIASSS